MCQCIVAWFDYSFLWMVFSFQPNGGVLVPYGLGYYTTQILFIIEASPHIWLLFGLVLYIIKVLGFNFYPGCKQASCSIINCVFVFPNTAGYICFFFVLFYWFHKICSTILYNFIEYYVVRGGWEVMVLKRSQSITVLKVQKPLLK